MRAVTVGDRETYRPGEAIEGLQFNKAVAALYELTTAIEKAGPSASSDRAVRTLILLASLAIGRAILALGRWQGPAWLSGATGFAALVALCLTVTMLFPLALAVTLTELVQPGVLTLSQAIAALSTNPARSRGMTRHGGPIEPDAPANLTLFDPSEQWTVDERALHSLSRNTPFAGRRLRGRVLHTLLRGRFTFRDGQPVRKSNR